MMLSGYMNMLYLKKQMQEQFNKESKIILLVAYFIMFPLLLLIEGYVIFTLFRVINLSENSSIIFPLALFWVIALFIIGTVSMINVIRTYYMKELFFNILQTTLSKEERIVKQYYRHSQKLLGQQIYHGLNIKQQEKWEQYSNTDNFDNIRERVLLIEDFLSLIPKNNKKFNYYSFYNDSEHKYEQLNKYY